MSYFSDHRRKFVLFRLVVVLFGYVHRTSSDSQQKDQQLQSVASTSETSAAEEPLVSTIQSLDRLPDLLIINPTFEPPQSQIPRQSVTRRELLLRTLQLRQRPVEVPKESHPFVPRAQPLPVSGGPWFRTDGKRREVNVQNTAGIDVPFETQQQLFNGGAERSVRKRLKGKKEVPISPMDKLWSNRPPLLRPKADRPTPQARLTIPTTNSDGRLRLKQQREVSSMEAADSLNQQRIQLQSPTEVEPRGSQQSLQYQQPPPYQFLPYPQTQQQQQPFQQRAPFLLPSPEGNDNNNYRQLPAESSNNLVYQQQQIAHFTEQHTNQQKPQQIAVPRRLNFYFTPSATTVNSDFTFAPGSPGLACLYGFPVPKYNTPRKRCIPDHPMCGIQFTCVMDVHAVDERGRELEQWWTQPTGWDGAQQQTFGAVSGVRTEWGEQQQRQNGGWAQ
uniref:Uncharacterized protein n=1 Tax=Globodera rostochiensis TaxID=31243 RepID=A0A914HCC0_GLORO